MTNVKVFADKASLSEAIATHILKLAAANPLKVALSGGSTPKHAYELLYRSDLDRSKLKLFMVDERYVPPTDERSNERMMREALGDGFEFHPIYREGGPSAAAEAYDELLRREVDRFDVVLLGMGDDGHTASIFPHMQPEFPQCSWCVASKAPVVCEDRVTMTPRAICDAKETIFLVAGAEKAERIHQVLEGPQDFESLPSQYIHRHSLNGQWWLDEAAARLL